MPAAIVQVSPSPTGADLNAVYVDAKGAVYVAGAAGVLMKSTDHGASWKPLAGAITGDVHALWGTGADVYAGADNDVVLVSHDAGATWRAATPKTGRTTAIMAGAAASATDVTAVGVNGVIVHSGDRGATWTVENTEAMGYGTNYAIAYGGGGGKGAISRFVVGDGGSSNVVIDGKWYGGGSSGDGGWRALTAVQGGFVAVGEQGRITRFDPAGAPKDLTPRATDRILRGVWRDGQTLVAVGETGGASNRATALRSTDGGVHWALVDAKTERNLGAIAGTAKDLWAVGDGGAVVHSTDAGATWAMASVRPLAASEVRTIVAGGKALVASGGGIARSTDGGKTWTRIRESANTLVVAAAGGLVAADPIAGVERSTDGGATWTKLAAAPRASTYRSIAAVGSTIAIVDGNITLLSPDGGATWGRAAPQAVDCVWAVGTALWVAGSIGSVMRSTDAGKTWAVVAVPSRDTLHYLAGWSDGTTIAIGGQTPTGGRMPSRGVIAVSTDAGTTWTVRDIPGHMAITALAGGHGMIVGTGDFGGAVISRDAGKTWTPLPFATPNWQSALAVDGTTLLVGSARGEIWRGAL